MRRMNPRQISESFNAQKQKFAKDCAKSGLDLALEDFSRAIGEMKAAGADLSVEIFGDATELGFAMFESTSIRTPVSGVLRIGPINHLFAFAVSINNQPVLKLAVSDFDIRFNGADGAIKDGKFDNKVRATVFDLRNDPDALVKFQEEALRMAARNEIVFQHDVADTFEKPNALKKPSFRMMPKSP